jgi:hypothetical protein
MAASHGPVILLHMGRVPTVVASSAAAAQEVMKARDLAFASRPRVRMAERLFYGRDMAFAPYGEHWRQARRVSVLHLLSQRRIHSFRRAREQEAAATTPLSTSTPSLFPTAAASSPAPRSASATSRATGSTAPPAPAVRVRG